MRRALGILLLAACGPATPQLARPLDERPTLTDVNSDPKIVEVNLVAAEGSAELMPGKPAAAIWGYRDGSQPNAEVSTPGPAIEANVGDQLVVHFKNELPFPTTIHWHGLRLPPAADGSTVTQNPVNTGGTYDYVYTLRDPGTFWYHPHLKEDEQIEHGLYGALIVHGGPEIPAAADRLFIVDDVKMAASGQLSTDLDALDVMLGRQGNVLLVNGQSEKQLEVASGTRERWRFINSANGRYFNLRVSGHPFTVFGWDGGAISTPYTTDTLLIAPGERYEVVIDFDDEPGAELALETIYYDRGHDIPDQGPKKMLTLEVGPKGRASPALPAMPSMNALTTDASTISRSFKLEEHEDPTGGINTTFTINGEMWPFNTTVMVDLNATEIWEIDNTANNMDHPFHLHGMFFQVLDVNGQPPEHQGWKDTINVPQMSTLRFAVQYDTLGMWMYHCHILEHAERGMMGDLMVMPPP
jgi:FtsP/CotA-like multicopper oxidase with cupredoxin domain